MRTRAHRKNCSRNRRTLPHLKLESARALLSFPGFRRYKRRSREERREEQIQSSKKARVSLPLACLPQASKKEKKSQRPHVNQVEEKKEERHQGAAVGCSRYEAQKECPERDRASGVFFFGSKSVARLRSKDPANLSCFASSALREREELEGLTDSQRHHTLPLLSVHICDSLSLLSEETSVRTLHVSRVG